MPRRTTAVLLSLLLALAGVGFLAPAAVAKGARPVVTAVSPGATPAFQRARVTVYGSHFRKVTKVLFGAERGRDVEVVSRTEIRVTTPSITSGRTVRVRVTTRGGTSRRSDGVLFTSTLPTAPPAPASPTPAPAAPALSSVTPSTGATSGGTAITLIGSGFLPGATVSVGGAPATGVQVVSASTVTATTPAYVSGPLAKEVSVTTSGGSASIAAGFTYTAGAPVLSSLTPVSGPTAGGTSVTVNGSGFVPGGTTVQIDAITAPATVTSSTSLTFTTPPHVAGQVSVSVVTSGGTSAPLAYTYAAAPTVASLTPDNGSVSGGTVVTVQGTNLTGTSSVTLGGVPATNVTVVSDTQLTITTPAHSAGAVNLAVTTSVDTATQANAFTYHGAV